LSEAWCEWRVVGGYRVVYCRGWKHLGEPFLGAGNDKVGRIITYTIPPDTVRFPRGRSVVTCPGATPWCRMHCYAKNPAKRISQPMNVSKYASNLVLFFEVGPDRFAEMLAEKIKRVQRARHTLKIVRVHVAGDFFSEEYVEAFRAVAESLPDYQFYAYTRSWLIPELKPSVERLRRLPNFVVYASTDPDTGPPPPGWLEACCVDTAYSPGFRPYTKTIRCREEVAGVTCEECKICIYGRASVHWEVIR
jgi:hypothetical protein